MGEVVFRGAQSRLRVVLHVDREIGPSHPHPLRPALDDVHETVLLLASHVVEQFGVAQIAFEELVAHRYSIGQLEKRAVTGFMTEHEPILVLLPNDDHSLLGIQVGVRRARLQRSRVTTRRIVTHFHGGYTLDFPLRQLCQSDWSRLLKDRVRPLTRPESRGPDQADRRHGQHGHQPNRRERHLPILHRTRPSLLVVA